MSQRYDPAFVEKIMAMFYDDPALWGSMLSSVITAFYVHNYFEDIDTFFDQTKAEVQLMIQRMMDHLPEDDEECEP